MKYRDEIIVFGMTLTVYALTRWDTSPYNAHVLQAQAFLHGHAWIDCPDYIERALVNGRRYQLHPPLPALMLTPLVALGTTNQNWFALVVGALDAALAYRLTKSIWLTVFFAFGTIMWYETINGSSWEVSMLVAVLMTLLALNEVFGNGRPLQVGMFAGAAFLSRYDLCLAWPVYLIFCVYRRATIRGAAGTSNAIRYTDALPFLTGCCAAAAIYIWFNYVRYGTLTDVGLLYYNPLNGNLPVAHQTTLFAWRFFPGNFFTLFYMAPKLDATFPYIHPMAGGQSILTTSPAFLLALRASWRRIDVALIAAMAILSALPVLFYVGNGMSQFGTRHFVATFPFLLVLMAMAELDQMGKVLIVVSVCLIGLGIYSIRTVGL